MEETELKQQTPIGSKEQRSRGMNLANEEHEKQLNIKDIGSELTSVTNKKQQRKVSETDVDYLISEFAINRNKAVNILRNMGLKQAVRHLVHS